MPGSSEGVASAGGGVSSGYAVTYRRTGGAQVSMVSGGTPGTYNRRESGGGAEGAELRGVSRSPGMTSKADRRAGIHISGAIFSDRPTSYNIWTGSGCPARRLENDKEQPLQGDEAEDEDVKSTETEMESTDGHPQSKTDDVQEREEEPDGCVKSQVDSGKDMAEITKKENDIPEEADALSAKEAEYLSQNQECIKEDVEDTQPRNKEKPTEEDYMGKREIFLLLHNAYKNWSDFEKIKVLFKKKKILLGPQIWSILITKQYYAELFWLV